MLSTSSITQSEQRYLQDAFRIAVGLKKDSEYELPFIPEHLQRLFLRCEEHESAQRDQWDNWEHGYSENYLRGALWKPECDLWINEQKKQLENQGARLASRWPKRHDFAVCLTHDVDYIGETMTFGQRGRELFRTAAATDLPLQQKLFQSVKGLAKIFLKRSNFLPETANTLEISYLIEKELGVTASYFFTTPPQSLVSKYDCLYDPEDRCTFLNCSYRVKDVMSFLVQEGFDVGLHGSYHSATAEGLLSEQKAFLEKAIKAPITTTRQHWLHLHLPRTWQLQEQAGILADTTLGFNRNIGFRAGTGLPFFAYDRQQQRQLSLIELPLVIQDGALVGANSLEYSPSYALSVVKEIIRQVKEINGCVTFLFHPDIFLKPGLAALYRSIIEHCLAENAWVTDLSQIQQWWRERAVTLS